MSIRMSTIKLASNARSLQENNQSECVCYGSHIHVIMHFDQYVNLNWANCELLLQVIFMVFFTKDTRHVGHKTNSA